MNHIAKNQIMQLNILGYYITNQSDSTYQATIEQIAGKMGCGKRDASARMAGNMMKLSINKMGTLSTHYHNKF